MKNKFIEKLSSLYSAEDLKLVMSGLKTEKRPVTFRTNLLRSTPAEIEKELDESGISYEKIDLFSGMYRLSAELTEKTLWDLEIYKNGKIYLQSFSSQLPTHFFSKNTDKINILDATAAPG